MNQKQTAAAAVTMLSEYFRAPLTDTAIEAYLIGLEELSVEELGVVTKRAIRECKFMPSVSELLAFLGRGGALALTAEVAEAWTAARWARRVHSYTTGVDFGPLVNAVIRSMGGWLVFCGHNDDALEAFERKKFESAFAAFRARAELGAMGEPLGGQFPGVERVAIGGRAPARQLEAAPAPLADLVRGLAEAKAV
jgi:hypothetical protein